MGDFIHLRTHSEYSITDSINRISDLVGAAASDNMPAIALTDLNNVFGMVKFYKGARGKGVKPIMGADLFVFSEENTGAPDRILLLAKNEHGYKRLSFLISEAYKSRLDDGHPYIKKEWLEQEEGIVALSGGIQGEIGRLILSGRIEEAQAAAKFWESRFPGSFFIELQRYGHPQEEVYIDGALDLCVSLDLPPVATHPVQFLKKGDFQQHDIRVCIAEQRVVTDKERNHFFTPDQYMKSRAEMSALFSDIPEALDNTVAIARMCNLSLTLGKSFLPDFPVPEGVTIDEFMVNEASKGLRKRMEVLYPDERIRQEKMPEYQARLDFETKTIIQMGFSGYFLIVADFINWGKKNGVPVGPGRGSGAGSLVAYSLGITDLDPLAYALLFERFLNPERVSMPDFDVDFCQENRGRVIEYVRHKYGEDSVSQIATFGTMSSKAVIKDVGRAMNMSYGFCDSLSKMIPVVQGTPTPLEDMVKSDAAFRARYERDEEVRNVIDQAIKLEGMSKSVGMHAGGVLIAPGRISDFCPLYKSEESAGTVSQFDKDDVEAVGLVKFDFLGLRNLTIIDLAVRYIKAQDLSFSTKMDELTFDDDRVYKTLGDGNTTAVFQLESEGMKKLMLKMKPDSFEDIIAALALYRPGPLGSGMVDDFVLRKKGKQKIDYFHSSLEGCLSPTYGVIVYQEQVMQIAQIIAGYTLGGADMLRRAMGKKKPEEMAKQRDLFIAGAIKNGHQEAFAAHLFDLMAKFAEYGFNKSHSAAYAFITYQTAWLKTYHCAAFMAATLSSDMADTDTVKIFYDDAVANGLRVNQPDINVSDYAFVPDGKDAIHYGLGAIKGVGENVARHIVAKRKNGPYKDFFDFCERLDKGMLNKRILEGLVKAGAFDKLDPDRAKLFASCEIALAGRKQKNENQGSLFDDAPIMSSVNYAKAQPWTKSETLEQEKTVLGFFVSGHPFKNFEKEFTWFRGDFDNSKLELTQEQVPVAGVLVAAEKKSANVVILKIDDGKAVIPVTLFKDQFEEFRQKLRLDAPILVWCDVSIDTYNNGIRCKGAQVMNLSDLRSTYIETITVDVSDKSYESIGRETFITKLKEVVQMHQGGSIRIRMNYINGQNVIPIEFDPTWSVTYDPKLMQDLRTLCGHQAISVSYKKEPHTRQKRKFAA